MPNHALISFIDPQGIERNTAKGKPIFTPVLQRAGEMLRRNWCKMGIAATRDRR
jgi:hypothetical protein